MGANYHRHIAKTLACSLLALNFVSVSAREVRMPPATEAEKSSAIRAWVSCEIEYADRLDDGYSDAMTIGSAVASSCRREMEFMATVITQGGREQVRLMLIDRFASHAVQDAAQVVLLARKRRDEQRNADNGH